MEFCLSLVSLHIIIKNLEEDIDFMLIMLAWDVIKLDGLLQKLLIDSKKEPNPTQRNVNWSM